MWEPGSGDGREEGADGVRERAPIGEQGGGAGMGGRLLALGGGGG